MNAGMDQRHTFIKGYYEQEGGCCDVATETGNTQGNKWDVDEDIINATSESPHTKATQEIALFISKKWMVPSTNGVSS